MFSRFSSPRRRRNKRATQRIRVSRSISAQFEALEIRCLLTTSTASASAISALTELLSPRFQLNTAAGVKPLASSAPVGLTPSQIRHAYGIDQILFDGGIVGDGAGQTIAIVDAYHSPTAFADLQVFDAAFHIDDPPSFRQVAQDGSTNFPTVDPAGAGNADGTWELETALDVEWAHAIAPAANILLVEATSSAFADLVQAAVNYARNQPGVVAVSMSFGGDEFSGETTYDSYFTTPSGHNGVTFLAATGDDGQPGGYPAYSPNVVAVGGTTLSTNAAGDYLGETGWSGSGGGTSTTETQPGYQSGTVTQSSTRRATPDVAFNASPNSGVAVYDSYDFGTAGWIQVGGTSFSTPAWAGLIAIADQGRSLLGLSSLDGRTETLPDLYQLPGSDFNDITSGNNGFAAGAGYDLVTGRGTPKANLVVGGLIGSTITGTVYSDANNDGVLDNGETGLAGWTVYDDVNNDGVFTPPSQLTATSNNVPITIPDLKTITSTITVSGAIGTIGDLNVNLTLHHTYDSDLVITLISPLGKTVTLANKNGGSSDNFLSTIFDDQATTSIASGSAPFSGSFRPISSLATLNGDDLNGVWTLQIADTVRRDSGTLNGWSLNFTSGSDIAVTTAADGSYKFVDVAPGVHHLREVPQADFAETQPASGVYTLSVAVGASIKGKDFGNYQSPPPPPPNTVFPPGDFNRDHLLTAADLPAMLAALTDLAAYQSEKSLSDSALLATGDLNGDGRVSNADIQPLLNAINAAESQTTANNATAAAAASTNSATGSPTVASSTNVAANSLASTETLSDTTSVALKKIAKTVRRHALASNLTSKQTAAVDHALETAFDFRHTARWHSLVDRVSHTSARAGAALRSFDAVFDRIIASV